MAQVDVIVSDQARQDVFTLLLTLRATAPKRAFRVAEKLAQTVERLSTFPESGRRAFDVGDEPPVREIVVEQLRLFYRYRPEPARVEVIAIFSVRQDVEAQLRSRSNMDENPKEE